MRSYSDAQLTQAIARSRSWRGVLRALGLRATSAGSMRSVRGNADRLGLDYTHFRGGRRWTEKQLASAVASATTWQQVCDELGLGGGSSAALVRGHAVRLGLETAHLNGMPSRPPKSQEARPRREHLRRAAPLMAAAWFELCGFSVSWPLEPTRYDLLVWRAGRAERIQVKTSTARHGATWQVRLATTRKEIQTYDPDEIDQFFVIDGDYHYYLIPVTAVGGLTAINISAYQEYRLSRV